MKQFISTTLCTVLLFTGTVLAQQTAPVPQPQPTGVQTEQPQPTGVQTEQPQPTEVQAEQPQQPAKTRKFRRFQVGVRGGINTVSQKFQQVYLGDGVVSAGPNKVGYDLGLVLRLNISKHLHLQSELNYNFANYGYRIAEDYRREVTLRTERLELPLLLGLQFGPLRFFGGVVFRLAQTQHSSSPNTLKVRFNDDDLAVMGGVGLNIRKFFIDFRITGYPFSNAWNDFSYDHVSKRVKVTRNLVYGGSIGFYF